MRAVHRAASHGARRRTLRCAGGWVQRRCRGYQDMHNSPHRRGAFRADSDAQRDAWAQHARRVAAKARFLGRVLRGSWCAAGAAHLPPPPPSAVRMVAASRALTRASAQPAISLWGAALMLCQAAQGWACAPQHTAAVADEASIAATRFFIACRSRLGHSFPCSSYAGHFVA